MTPARFPLQPGVAWEYAEGQVVETFHDRPTGTLLADGITDPAVGALVAAAPDLLAFVEAVADEVDRPGGTLQTIRWKRVPDFRALLARAKGGGR